MGWVWFAVGARDHACVRGVIESLPSTPHELLHCITAHFTVHSARLQEGGRSFCTRERAGPRGSITHPMSFRAREDSEDLLRMLNSDEPTPAASARADELDDLLPGLPEFLADGLPELTSSTYPSTQPPEVTTCWGTLLSGSDERCARGFVPGKGHFKNHFCGVCRSLGIKVPVQRTHALDSTQQAQFENNGGRGLWSEKAGCGPEHRFRLVNQTLKCSGPRLLILENASVSWDLAWASIPTRWIIEGHVHFLISKGTLTPADAGFVTRSLNPVTSLNLVIGSGARSDEDGDSKFATLKRPRASPASDSFDGSFVDAVTSNKAIDELHEQLERLVVQTVLRPLDEQEAMGIDDEQRVAFVSLLAPLQVSRTLLQRGPSNVPSPSRESEPLGVDMQAAGQAAHSSHAMPISKQPTLETIANLHAKTFGALDAIHGDSHELVCRSRALGDGDLEALVYILRVGLPNSTQALQSLRRLDLSFNYFTSASAPLLVTVLAEAHCLVDLDLSGTAWGDPAALTLLNALVTTGIINLKSLQLQRTAIASSAAAAIARIITETGAPKLEILSLECNRIPDDGLSALCGSLLLRESRLRILCLGNAFGGNAIGDTGLGALAGVLTAGCLASLERLGLSYNLITDDGAAVLAEALAAKGRVSGLLQLNISANRLTDSMVNNYVDLARTELSPRVAPRHFCLLAKPQLRSESCTAGLAEAALTGSLEVPRGGVYSASLSPS